jgi:hypothetical protein
MLNGNYYIITSSILSFGDDFIRIEINKTLTSYVDIKIGLYKLGREKSPIYYYPNYVLYKTTKKINLGRHYIYISNPHIPSRIQNVKTIENYS